jgi:chromosome segregation ATPase
MIQRKSMFVLTLFLTAALAGMAGNAAAQSSDAYKKAADTGKKMKELQDQLTKAKAQIEKTVAALNAVVQPGGDLPKKYKSLTDQLKELGKYSEDLRKRTTEMRARGAEYFSAWEKEHAAIQNEALRKKSQERQAAVKARFEGIVPLMQKAKETAVPFTANLQDVATYLGTDLTAGGVAAVGDMVKEIQGQSKALQQNLDAVLAEMQKVSAELSATQP